MVETLIFDIHCFERGIEDKKNRKKPSKNTVSAIIRRTLVPIRSLRPGEDIRKKKSKEVYLDETYAVLGNLYEKHRFLPEDM